MPNALTQTELTKMERAHNHEDDRMRVLYEASYKGCVSTLNTLIQEDPLILHRINSQTIFIETPLHISALLGHLDFTKILLTHKPNLACESNSFGSTPLHLASAEGQIHIVKELLVACAEACLVQDQEGRIPLHYAVIRGRLDVVTELIRVKRESLMISDKGKTIFHLCVTYNHLEILKALVELHIDDTYELLNEKETDGKNTILHLAIMLKQVETVRYLMSIPEIREAWNLENDMGYTAADIVQRIPQDLKSLEIQVILMNCGIKIEKKEMNTRIMIHRKGCWRNLWRHMERWFKYNGNWLEDMRGNLSLVATVISTITFQAAINPPGGVVQQGIFHSSNRDGTSEDNPIFIQDGVLGCLPFKDDNYYDSRGDACPGEAMLASVYPDGFGNFIIFNTISFVASVGVILLLVSGVPLKNKFVMWLLSILMCITLTFLVLAYFVALSALTPDRLWTTFDQVYQNAGKTWVVLLGLVALYITTHFIIWVVKKLKKIINHRISTCPRIRNGSGCNCLI